MQVGGVRHHAEPGAARDVKVATRVKLEFCLEAKATPAEKSSGTVPATVAATATNARVFPASSPPGTARTLSASSPPFGPERLRPARNSPFVPERLRPARNSSETSKHSASTGSGCNQCDSCGSGHVTSSSAAAAAVAATPAAAQAAQGRVSSSIPRRMQNLYDTLHQEHGHQPLGRIT